MSAAYLKEGSTATVISANVSKLMANDDLSLEQAITVALVHAGLYEKSDRERLGAIFFQRMPPRWSFMQNEAKHIELVDGAEAGFDSYHVTFCFDAAGQLVDIVPNLFLADPEET